MCIICDKEYTTTINILDLEEYNEITNLPS